MINEKVVEYIKLSLEKGASSEATIQALVGNGWNEKEVRQALELIELQKQAPKPEPIFSPGPIKKSRPDINSPYSKLLAIVLFVSLFVLINKSISDIDDSTAPYSKPFYQMDIYKDRGMSTELKEELQQNSIALQKLDTEYRQLTSQAYGGQSTDQATREMLDAKTKDNRAEYQKLQQERSALQSQASQAVQEAQNEYNDKHNRDVTIKLVINAVIILPLLLLAFLIHFSFGERKKQFKILSFPFYATAGWTLIRLLYDVSKFILDTKIVFGVYIVLGIIISVLTGIIFFVQRFRHTTQLT